MYCAIRKMNEPDKCHSKMTAVMFNSENSPQTILV
jgi:hypothetical protein